MKRNLAFEFYKLGLSKRQLEVGELILIGLNNSEVAERLFITEATVKFHASNIYKQLGIKSRAQFFVWAIQHLNDEVIQEEVKPKEDIKINSPNELPSGECNGL